MNTATETEPETSGRLRVSVVVLPEDLETLREHAKELRVPVSVLTANAVHSMAVQLRRRVRS